MAYKTLRLTKPPMRGPLVASLRRSLHHNGFGQDFLGAAPLYESEPAKANTYDAVLAHRVAATKWWLGYPVGAFTTDCDGQFVDYLVQRDPLTPDMIARRKVRTHPAPVVPPKPRTWQQEAFAVALERIGWHETPPGSNNSEATRLWGHGPMPWCAVYISENYLEAARRLHIPQVTFSTREQHYQYVPTILELAKAHKAGLREIGRQSAVRGDLIIHNGGSHITQFDRWAESGHYQIGWDIGANEGRSGRVYHDLHSIEASDAVVRVDTP
jgi:hypothetical protein